MESRVKLSFLLLLMTLPAIVYCQEGLLGTWKYVSPNGEMTMQINTGTILINNQSFPYKAQGNVLMITDGATPTPYPYMLDGNKLSIEFPGGMEILFNRAAPAAPGTTPQGSLPQSMSRPPAVTAQGQQTSPLAGRWLFQNQQGQLVLEFISSNQLSFNGETTDYQLKEGIIQAKGEYGWIDYPYTLSQGTLTITFPDGSRFPFTKTSPAVTAQQGIGQPAMNQQASAGGSVWQLKGSLCSWSGSSSSSSSYSRTQKIVFDGKGNFQFGSESSFSSNAGIAYGGNPNVETGTYSVAESNVTLRFRSGETYVVKINMRQDNGMITELMHNGTLYATGLCDK
jgi:hypothetical protein